MGWLFTEMGRQPWVVFGLMTTANAVSPGVSAAEVWASLIGFTLVYVVLAVVEVGLILKYVRKGPEEFVEPPSPKWRADPDDPDHPGDADKPLVFAY
jgi:cytochrome d ubiquinol oxidase subunit I